MPLDSKIANFNSVFLFLVAGMCEIGGGWMVRQWFREGKRHALRVVNGLMLNTLSDLSSFIIHEHNCCELCREKSPKG